MHRGHYLGERDIGRLEQLKRLAKFVRIRGQSNAEGYASAATLTDQTLVAPNPNVQQQIVFAPNAADPPDTRYYPGGTTTPPSTPHAVQPHLSVGIVSDAMGIELSLAKYLHDNAPGEWAMTKYAIGGANLAVHLNPDGTFPSTGGNFYTRAKTLEDDYATSSGRTRSGLIWIQGEGDANDATRAAAYEANLASYIARDRTDAGLQPFLFNRLSINTSLAHEATVRTAQEHVAEDTPWVTMIDVDDLTLADGLHFNADAYDAMGDRFGPALLAALNTTTLTANIDDSADPVTANGSAFSYLIDVTNTGSTAAVNVTVVLTLPSGVGYVSGSGTGWTFANSGQRVTAKRASGAVGALSQITINVTAPTAYGSGSITANGHVVASNVTTKTTISETTTLTAPSVTADGTSLVWIPQNAGEYANFIAAQSLTGKVQTPDALWPMQDLSGSLLDAIGAFNLAASGTNATYNNTVTGWTMKFIRWINAATGAFISTAAGLPDISTTSIAIMVIGRVTASPTSARGIMGAGTSNTLQQQVSTTPLLFAVSGANSQAGASDPRNVVQPWILKLDKTAGVARLYTAQEKIVVTPSASGSGKQLRIGGSPGLTTSPAMDIGWGCAWFGAKAELLTDANAKDLIIEQGEGLWAPAWT